MLQPKKTSRDYPLSATPEPIFVAQKQIGVDAGKRLIGTAREMGERMNAEKKANKAMNELRDKKMKADMENIGKQAYQTERESFKNKK